MPLERLIEKTIVSSQSYGTSNNFGGVKLQKAGKEAKGYSAALDLNVTTPSADNFLAGESEINTLTFEAKASMDDGEYVVITDTNGDTWAIAADLTGSSAAPTGAIWAAIPAARKAQVDLSSDTTAIEVAASFEVAFDALTGFTAVCVTDDTAADGTMTFTQVARGPVANAQSLLEDDAGAGGVGIAETNAGVASEVDVTADEITLTAHGLATATVGQLTSTGTLPAGLSAATNYYVIVVDTNTIKLATSAANAQAGTPVNITGQGTDGATHTFTPTAISGGQVKLQGTVDDTDLVASPLWVDITNSEVSISASDEIIWDVIDPMYSSFRVVLTLTSGQVQITLKVVVKG